MNEKESLATYEAAISPAFQTYQAAGSTDEAFKTYSAIVTPLWAEHEARLGGPEDATGDLAESDDSGNEDNSSYADSTRAELVTLLEARSLDTNGNKTVLVARLEADDDANADANADDADDDDAVDDDAVDDSGTEDDDTNS